MPIITVKLFDGRSDQEKRDYAKAITDAAVTILGCDANAVDVLYEDIKKNDWATAGVLWSDK